MGLIVVCAGLGSVNVQAHEELQTVPDSPGLRVGFALAAAKVQAAQALPSQRMTGYLLRGDAGVDRRDHWLEHGVLELGWRISPALSLAAAAGVHDRDRVHTESAWMRYAFEADSSVMKNAVSAGRMRPQQGPVITQAGHMDRFALTPLSRKVLFDGDWIDDGVQWSLQNEWGPWTGYGDLGLWRARAFPGAAGSALAPSLHMGVALGDWRIDGFVALFRPQGRGGVAQSAAGGHTHQAPDCSRTVSSILCFEGRSQLAGLSGQWDSHDWPVTVEGAYQWRRDHGTLQSTNGQADHTGLYSGGWVQVLWQMPTPWGKAEWGLRGERIRARLFLSGAGAQLLAQEAGFLNSSPLQRKTAILGWQPSRWISVYAEAGQEQQGAQTVRFAALRFLIRVEAVRQASRTASYN